MGYHDEIQGTDPAAWGKEDRESQPFLHSGREKGVYRASSPLRSLSERVRRAIGQAEDQTNPSPGEAIDGGIVCQLLESRLEQLATAEDRLLRAIKRQQDCQVQIASLKVSIRQLYEEYGDLLPD